MLGRVVEAGRGGDEGVVSVTIVGEVDEKVVLLPVDDDWYYQHGDRLRSTSRLA